MFPLLSLQHITPLDPWGAVEKCYFCQEAVLPEKTEATVFSLKDTKIPCNKKKELLIYMNHRHTFISILHKVLPRMHLVYHIDWSGVHILLAFHIVPLPPPPTTLDIGCIHASCILPKIIFIFIPLALTSLSAFIWWRQDIFPIWLFSLNAFLLYSNSYFFNLWISIRQHWPPFWQLLIF